MNSVPLSAGTSNPMASSGSSLSRSLEWVELIKATALLWIFLNHVVERAFGSPHFANPSSDWPSLEVRLAQLHPLEGHGLWDVPMSLLRFIGWSGDQGVQLFLIVSGFGLTWGLLMAHRTFEPLHLGSFYSRRAARVYPLWWGAHLMFMAAGMSLAGGSYVLSLMGFRATTGLMYFYAPAWWYIGLLLQLYLVFPLLWEGLRRWGPWPLLCVVCGLSFTIRGAGLAWFDAYLDAWSRGAIFITRLPEFVTGVCLAVWMHTAPQQTDALLRSKVALLWAVVAYVAGTALSLTLAGMTVAPYLVGSSAFVLLYALFNAGTAPSFASRPLLWIGRHTFALFLVHDPIVRICVPAGASGMRAIAGTLAALLISVILALALEWAVNLATRWVVAWWKRGALLGVAWPLALMVGASTVVLVGSELAVRQFDPQEIDGWGERPALEPHPTFGWRLRRSQQTRLRWEGYDYAVVSNSLGFPGPEYPAEKSLGTLRIFAVGDAFTSAEGVDTDRAWPRLLEARLHRSRPENPAQVMNFAVTGYGPEQTTAVIQSFAPRYRPDVIVYGFFVNEFLDVLTTNEQFRRGIGFDRPDAVGWKSVLQLAHLRRFLQLRIRGPLLAHFRGTPEAQGYFLGGFAALERGQVDIAITGQALVRQRLAQIRQISDITGTRVIVAMIPAPVQVCGPDQLRYFPRHVDLLDQERFDLEQPQRLTRAIADPLGFEVWDLREALIGAPGGCPYRGDNMHFTESGHRTIAEFVATRLLQSPAKSP